MKPDTTNTSVLILAGGQSRRMNHSDKGLLVWENKTLIQHVIDNIKKQLNHIIINANQNLEQYQQLDYELISDSIDGFKGPLAGIMSGMQYCSKADYLLVLPCDCPTPPADLFQRLAESMDKDAQANIAIAHDGVREQPLFGLYKTSLLPQLENALQNEQYKVRDFIKNNQTVFCDFSDQPEAFKNFNRPEDMN